MSLSVSVLSVIPSEGASSLRDKPEPRDLAVRERRRTCGRCTANSGQGLDAKRSLLIAYPRTGSSHTAPASNIPAAIAAKAADK